MTTIYEKMQLCQTCYAGITGQCAPCGKDFVSALNCEHKKAQNVTPAAVV